MCVSVLKYVGALIDIDSPSIDIPSLLIDITEGLNWHKNSFLIDIQSIGDCIDTPPTPRKDAERFKRNVVSCPKE